uniref:Uncharacterized protein n=1 Tax=Arundo donax TaxID=35708 RepID=A0A0A9R5X5_ARUDO
MASRAVCRSRSASCEAYARSTSPATRSLAPFRRTSPCSPTSPPCRSPRTSSPARSPAGGSRRCGCSTSAPTCSTARSRRTSAGPRCATSTSRPTGSPAPYRRRWRRACRPTSPSISPTTTSPAPSRRCRRSQFRGPLRSRATRSCAGSRSTASAPSRPRPPWSLGTAPQSRRQPSRRYPRIPPRHCRATTLALQPPERRRQEGRTGCGLPRSSPSPPAMWPASPSSSWWSCTCTR